MNLVSSIIFGLLVAIIFYYFGYHHTFDALLTNLSGGKL